MKDTLKPGIEHEFRFRVSTSKTVSALYPESDEFQAWETREVHNRQGKIRREDEGKDKEEGSWIRRRL
jgi:hypothetical protein